MTITTSDANTILVYANKYDAAILEVVEDRLKAIKVVNTENSKSCWLPKSGLKLRKPGVATYENEYTVASWFSNKLTDQQERVLNLLG